MFYIARETFEGGKKGGVGSRFDTTYIRESQKKLEMCTQNNLRKTWLARTTSPHKSIHWV